MTLRTDDSNSKLKDEWLLKNFCLDILSEQNQKCSDECQFWSENVRCLTIISSTTTFAKSSSGMVTVSLNWAHNDLIVP